MSDPDVRLMMAFQAGDPEAFGELVRRHAQALVNYFFFQSRDMDLAEDCAQEVWARIFRVRDDYSPRALFRTFLFRVARNYWIDVYRSAARRGPETSLDAEGGAAAGDGETAPLLERLAAEGADPARESQRSELSQILARALSRLPDEMRDVYLLGELEGLPYAEIASLLDVPIGTVKSRMFNAVRRLRSLLETYDRLSEK